MSDKLKIRAELVRNLETAQQRENDGENSSGVDLWYAKMRLQAHDNNPDKAKADKKPRSSLAWLFS